MALREKLDNYNAEIVIGPEDDPQVTNAQLAVEEWNRTTIADGAWLQQNAIGPLSARDIVLANAIDDTNDALSALSAQMEGQDGRSLKSVNGRFFSGGEAWEGSKDAVVPDGTYVKNDEVIYVPQSDGVILSMNDNDGHAHQLKIKENEIGYRYLAGASTAEAEGTIPSAKYKYDTEAGDFRSLVMNATESGNFVVTSAGLQKLECDDATIGFNDDNQLYVKNYPSVWMVTEDYAINAQPNNAESFLHGGDLHVASANYSTIGIGQIIADEGTAIMYSLIQGSSLYVKNNARIDTSLIVPNGSTVSGDVYHSLLMNNNVVDNLQNVLLGGAGGVYATNIFASLIWGYGNHNDDQCMIHAGGSCNTSGNDGLAVFGRGGSHAYDNDTTLFIAEGASAVSAQHSFLSKSGGSVIDVKRSVVIDDSGKDMKDVHSSVVAGSFKQIYDEYTVNDITNSVVVGDTNQLAYGADTSIIAANTLAFDTAYNPGTEPISASIFVGNNLHYRSGITNVLAVGTNLGVKGSNSFAIGSDMYSYGDNTFQYGIGNHVNTFTSGGASACSINIGRNNTQGYGGAIQIGYDNDSKNAFNISIGTGNISNGINGHTFGDRNQTWDGAYAFGESNAVYMNTSYAFGHDNIVYSEDSFVFGKNNIAGYDNTYMIGEGLQPGQTYTVILGRYNISLSDSVLEIGWGTSNTDRNTMFRIDREGNVYCSGKVYAPAFENNSTWSDKMVKPTT